MSLTEPSPPSVAPNALAEPRAGTWWTAWPGRLLRLLLALLPLIWLSRQVRWSAVAASAVQVGPRGMALALAAEFGALAVGALRWRVMLRAYGADPAGMPPLRTLLRHSMVGQYFAVLPTGVAGEAVRGYRVAHCLPNAATSYVLLFVERIAGLLGLLVIAGVAAVASPALLSGPVALAMDIGVALALACGLVAFGLPQLAARLPCARARLAAVPLAGPMLVKIPAARSLGGPTLAVLLSVLSQLCVVLAVAALVAPLEPAATVAVCARVVPAIVLVTYVPVTPGGLGQRELAFVHFFALVGVGATSAMAASLLFFVVWLSLSFAGGLVLLYERVRGIG